MNISLACSPANEELLPKLKVWLGLTTHAEVYRLALATSFAQPDATELTLEGPIPAGDLVVKDPILFGEDEKIYLGVLRMLHRLDDNTPPDKITDYLRLHLNRGLQLLVSTLQSEADAYSQLLYLIKSQQVYLGQSSDDSAEPIELPDLMFPAYNQPIELIIGSRGDEPVRFTLNSRQYTNQHMAVVGRSGTGKTYFCYSLLSQCYRQSQQRVHFLFIDYKGLSEGRLSADQEWFRQQTNFQVIDLINTPFPFNPIRLLRNPNSRKQSNLVRNFADIITGLVNLGELQRNTLIDVLQEQLAAVRDYLPTIESLNEAVKNMDRKADKLTSVLGGLCNLFEDRLEFEDFLRQNTYLSVDSSLSDEARIASVVLVLNLILTQFSRLGDAESTDTHAGLRYLVLIDEAHIVFKNNRALRILDELIRLIRSRGVGIILATQSLSEFLKENLAANIATTFLFDGGGVQPKHAADFLRLRDNQRPLFIRELQNLQRFECLTNLVEYGGYLRFSTQRRD